MRILQYGSVWQLTFFPALFPVNCYLVEEEEGVSLIDAGLPNSHKGIKQVLRQLGKPLNDILLTHAHGDHIGSLDSLAAEFPDASVCISERDSFLLKGDTSLFEHEAQTPIKGGVPKNVQTEPDRLLKGGERIGSLLVIPAPGHTPGSLAFKDMRNDMLIVGDAFQVRGGLAVSGKLKWKFPFPAFATWNKEEAVKTARTLIAHQPSSLAAGHGNVLCNPVEMMAEAVEEAERSLPGGRS
ncbi:MBL fold metallo-hydrolase [Bacillus velezensis]|uniref:MBL fold metallo-hydrolase n=1 Tax=Bacillus velezensis TaxID=492670 RepID=UPI0005B62538|nr:MBL fold metallo-hydrolase [Bacillus velezensis]AWK46378.1 MBL fold metallo-hydrolase [Bacillus velezensis]